MQKFNTLLQHQYLHLLAFRIIYQVHHFQFHFLVTFIINYLRISYLHNNYFNCFNFHKMVYLVLSLHQSHHQYHHLKPMLKFFPTLMNSYYRKHLLHYIPHFIIVVNLLHIFVVHELIKVIA
jgi:hypothetical protein